MSQSKRIEPNIKRQREREREPPYRLKLEQIEDENRLNGLQQAELQAEEIRKKKEQGWTENDLEILQILKRLSAQLGANTTLIQRISVANQDLEDTARQLHGNRISLSSAYGTISAFFWAISFGHRRLADLLIINDEVCKAMPYDQRDPWSNQRTALQLAAELGRSPILALILEYLPQATDPRSNDLAFVLAIHNGHRRVVEFFLRKHAVSGMPLTFCACGPESLTVFEAMSKQDWPDLMERMFTAYGIASHRTVVEAQEKTALHMAAECPKAVSKLLKSAHLHPDVKDSTGSTPLLKAAENGRTEIAQLLLQNPKTDINAKNNSGDTALLIALEKGRVSLAQLFIGRSDLNVNATNRAGATALIMATFLGCSLSVATLLQHSDVNVHHRAQTANMQEGSPKWWSALEIARAKGFHFIEHLLLTSGSATQHNIAPLVAWYSCITSANYQISTNYHNSSPRALNDISSPAFSYGPDPEPPQKKASSTPKEETNFKPVTENVKDSVLISKGRRPTEGSPYSSSSFSKAVASAVSFSAKASSSLLHTQSTISSNLTTSTTNTINQVGQSSLTATSEVHDGLCTRTTKELSRTIDQAIHQISNQVSGPVSTSDGVDWGLAAPAAVATLLSVALAGYALKMQRSGVKCQSETMLLNQRMNSTMQNMEERLSSILDVIRATQSSLQNGSSSGSPPDLSTLSLEDIQVLRYLTERIKSSSAESSRQEIASFTLDSGSEYTSEDRTLPQPDPNNSMKLVNLDTPTDQAYPEPQVVPEAENQAHDNTTPCDSESDQPPVSFLLPGWVQREQQRILDDLPKIRLKSYLKPKGEDLDLSAEDNDLFNNLHEELARLGLCYL